MAEHKNSVYSNYKYCIVPMCESTSVTTPNKHFVSVPKHPSIRNKWCIAMNRCSSKNETLSCKSTRHVCEDHFNFEEDVENYMRIKIMGHQVRLKLKTNVVPHIFECQKKREYPSNIDIPVVAKRSRLAVIQEAMESVKQPQIYEEKLQQLTIIPSTSIKKECIAKSNKEINVQKLNKTTTVSPLKKSMITRDSQIDSPTNMSETNTTDLQVESNSRTSEYQYSKSEDFKPWSQLMSIEYEPKLCLGIPKENYFVINLLLSQTSATKDGILIILRKIRLNESFTKLALHFDQSVSNVSSLFSETLKLIFPAFSQLIIWPNEEKIKKFLPMAFRSKYSNVQSIIDFIEIQIKKPSNLIYQTRTWSRYKNCNTIKYLISCTPDGLVNFISEGYEGGETNSTIVEDSGFLDRLKPGAAVMVDKEFKQIAQKLTQKECDLVRLPSVETVTEPSKIDVQELERIAELRKYVEGVINRLQEFEFLKPDACVEDHLIQNLDYIITVACGIINLQETFINYNS